jgi:ABC-type glycerol-3-phosphate transport system substrate-binding protein
MMKNFVVLLMLLLLAACSRGKVAETVVTNPTETSVTDPTDAITLRIITQDWQLSSYRTLAEIFEAENPDIAIKIVSYEETLGLGSAGRIPPDDAAERLVSAADLIPTDVLGTINFASGLLLDLGPLIETDTAFDEADFYPNALDYFKSDGGVWGLPGSLHFELIFYNKDAFDAASYSYPQAGWSWDDLLAAAQATTLRENNEVVQWGLVHSRLNPQLFVRPRTGPLIDITTDPPTVHFDRPEVASALQWYVDLFLLHEVAPNLEEPEPDEKGIVFLPEYELIAAGKAAMWVDYSGAWPWRSGEMNVGVAPFPVDAPGDRTTPVNINGFVLSAGTRHPEAAWRWLKFLSQQPSASFGWDTAVPARRSVAEAAGFWDRVDPELGDTLRYALGHAYFFRFGIQSSALYEAVTAVFTENRPVAAALADAQAQAEIDIANSAAAQEKTEAVEIVVGEPEDTALSEGAVSIVFTTMGGVDGLTPYRNLAKTFQEQNPDVVIELKTPDFSGGPIYLHNLAANSDCLLWYGGAISEQERAAVLNLEPFLAADPELGKEDFYPQTLDAFSYQGQLWGVPAGINVMLIMYNKALFDQAGIPYPQDIWTMDEFLAAAVALTVGDDPETRQYGYVPQEFELDDLTAFVERLGAQFLDDSVDPPQLTFTHPDTVEAMRWFTALTTEFGVKPTFMTNVGTMSANTGRVRKTLIENGRAAMWSYQGRQSYPEINIDGLDVGVIPLPLGPDGTATMTGAITGYFISAGTEHKQACWQWIKFLGEQFYLVSVGNSLPARRSIAESATYVQTVGAELAAVNRAAAVEQTGLSLHARLNTNARWLGNGAWWWLSYAYDQILSSGVTVEEALAAVQGKADVYRDCVITRDALENPGGQRTCLGEVDDTVPDFLITVRGEE